VQLFFAGSAATSVTERSRRRFRETRWAGVDRLFFEMYYCNESDNLQMVWFRSVSVRRLASIRWMALNTVL
jgi:hypothetical protein